ncbi:hypothetical protein [Cyanobacterium sp. Dongsha4]|uniref:hypothetical protein n=1 Tax=Cyanobacterium sp. DS4 TaxID=2878255 RepID=UPI002E821A97|nr:hypothetical protein [Cyanobacterium sp. Dongsha4]WVL02497.1 hypothetical protein Dongsha4_18685 [Cyanobacterium sp. Dongsha4]
MLIKELLSLINPFISSSVLRKKLPKKYKKARVKGHLLFLEYAECIDFNGRNITCEFEDEIITITEKGLGMLGDLQKMENKGK